MNTAMNYNLKALMSKAKPRSDGGYRLDIQVAKTRKTFYSARNGDSGRRECAQKALCWLEGRSCTSNIHWSTDYVFSLFFDDKQHETTDIYNLKNYYKNHIAPLIGTIPIIRLTRQDLKRVILIAYSKDLSEKTLKNIRGVLSSFCLFLYDSDIRYDLSTKNIKIPRSARKSVKNVLSPEGIYIVFSHDYMLYNNKETPDDLVNAYRLAIACGLRPGEILGLQWGDITNDGIHIQRAINAKGHCTNGKNSNANRVIPHTKYTRGIFAAQEQFRRTSCPTERVFGDYAEPTLCARWKRYCSYNGIPYITPYELRHTFASIYKRHLPKWVYDELIGHAHSGLDGVYMHPMADDMDDVPDILEKALYNQYKLGELAYHQSHPNTKEFI